MNAAVRVLIVEEHPRKGPVWASHLQRIGVTVHLVPHGWAAIRHLARAPVELVAIGLHPEPSAGFAVADYTAYRQPHTPIVLIAQRQPWADPQFLMRTPNTVAVIGWNTPPGDLAAMLARHAASAELAPSS